MSWRFAVGLTGCCCFLGALHLDTRRACVFYSYRNETDAEYQFDKDFLKATPELSRPTSGAEDIVQFTGCMDRANYPSQLNPEDEDGVYHNLDGDNATDLSGRRCEAFEWYVECLQPASGQLAVRCRRIVRDVERKEPGKEEDGGNDAA
ncbi:hypothetical protein PC9H_009985 [Pleurotus ostreatus]|uniref:Uncharacterized protein n=1 Tax=Pleurotus ostreatus TaxID=5322 RepID=A0A8H7DNG7_PLEOS|nr:uncharacterized protein PC9H_009985 [Pleurotus ostreatus]KAF7424674.1 hypothetical protein PC9H_009985 [Pleurotus ostreatus]